MRLQTYINLKKISGTYKDVSEYKITHRAGKECKIDQVLGNCETATLRWASDAFAKNPRHVLMIGGADPSKNLIIGMSLLPRLGIGRGSFSTVAGESVIVLLTKTTLELFVYKTIRPAVYDYRYWYNEPFSRYRRKDKLLIEEIDKLRSAAIEVDLTALGIQTSK